MLSFSDFIWKCENNTCKTYGLQPECCGLAKCFGAKWSKFFHY